MITDTPGATIESALDARTRGDLDGALRILRRAAKDWPGEPSILFALGEELDRQDEPARAVRVLREATRIAPDSAEILNALGNAEQAARRLDAALDCYRRALALAPEAALLEINVGDTLRQLGQRAEARQHLLRALTLDPSALPAHFHLAVIAMEEDDPGQALAHLDDCDRLNAYLPEGLALRAMALARTGQTAASEALLDFNRFVTVRELDPPPGYGNIRKFNRALERHILGGRLTRDPFSASTRGGRHGDDLLAGAEGPAAELNVLLRGAFASYIDGMPDDPGHPFLAARPHTVRLIAQANILDSAGYLDDHVHPQAWASGAYYVRLPAEVGEADDKKRAGWLRFGVPPANVSVTPPYPVRYVRPREGTLVMFPAYFYHGTIPFKSRKHRMSLGVDVIPR